MVADPRRATSLFARGVILIGIAACSYDYDVFGASTTVAGTTTGDTTAGAGANPSTGGAGANGSGGAGASTGAAGGGTGATGGGPCVNRALDFDGNDDRVELEDGRTLNGLATLTVEAWINPADDLDDVERHIVSHHDHDERQGWLLFVVADQLVFRVYGNSQFYDDARPIDVAPDTWHHVAGVLEAQTLSVYLDGVRGGPAVPIPVLGAAVYTGRPSIGASASEDDDYWDGLIDEVRISSVARYSADFAVPSAPFNPDGSTLALYHFDEADGGQAIVDAANQLAATLGDDGGGSGDPTRVDVPCIDGF